jgi:hypothetical protein
LIFVAIASASVFFFFGRPTRLATLAVVVGVDHPPRDPT